jgi:hypothetical protein
MLADAVNHYDQFFGLGLSQQQKSDLVERRALPSAL